MCWRALDLAPGKRSASLNRACAEEMTHTRLKVIVLLPLWMAKPALSQVTTSQYDNARTNATLSEKVLTPQNVSHEHFGKLGAFNVYVPVYAQPLYLPNVEVPGQGTHNV